MEREHKDIKIAFSMVLKAIDSILNEITRKLTQDLDSDDEITELLVQQLKQIKKYRKKVIDLQYEFQTIFSGIPPTSVVPKLPKLPRNERTPNTEFYIPILQSLVELGGSAPMGKVLNAVEKKMAGRLTEVDLAPTKENPVRWRNTAHWARFELKQLGYIASNSPWGIWEITPEGRKWLDDQSY